MLPLQWARVPSLVRELRSCKLRGTAKKEKKRKKKNRSLFNKQHLRVNRWGIGWEKMFAMSKTGKGYCIYIIFNIINKLLRNSNLAFTRNFCKSRRKIGKLQKNTNREMDIAIISNSYKGNLNS